jgi:hypothetical protein
MIDQSNVVQWLIILVLLSLIIAKLGERLH